MQQQTRTYHTGSLAEAGARGRRSPQRSARSCQSGSRAGACGPCCAIWSSAGRPWMRRRLLSSRPTWRSPTWRACLVRPAGTLQHTRCTATHTAQVEHADGIVLPELPYRRQAASQTLLLAHLSGLRSVRHSIKGSCGAAGGNPYATPEVSHHPTQEMAVNPKLAPEAHNGKPSVP